MFTTSSTAAQPSRCLSIETDVECENKVEFCCSNGEPNLEDLQIKPTAKTISIRFMNNQREMKHFTIRLALVLKAHPGITTIHFSNSHIEELASLYVAIADRPQLLSFQFDGCSFEPNVNETLRFMLENNLIEQLLFNYCHLDEANTKTIYAGLCKNQSLVHFDCVSHGTFFSTTLMRGALKLLKVNQNLVKLSMNISDNKYWDLFRAAKHYMSLQSLKLVDSKINLPSMEAIMMMLFMMKSLKKVHFETCQIKQDAIAFLTFTLSNNKLLDTLILESVVIIPIDNHITSPHDWRFGALQVDRLEMIGSFLNRNTDTFSRSVDQLTVNHYIQHLEFGGGVVEEGVSDEAMEKICNVLLRQSIGPSTIGFHCSGESQASTISNAMQQNTSVKALTISFEEDYGAVVFAQGLATMQHLRKLTIKLDIDFEHTEEFFEDLQESMDQNTTLWTLSFGNLFDNYDAAQEYLPAIRRCLAINRVGRHLLMAEQIPPPLGLWAHVLARSTHEVEGIYFVLCNKPDLMGPTRKRKNMSTLW